MIMIVMIVIVHGRLQVVALSEDHKPENDEETVGPAVFLFFFFLLLLVYNYYYYYYYYYHYY